MLEDGPRTRAESANLGAFFLRLITDRSWVARRVETIKVVDLDRIERSISLDLEVERIRTFAKDAGLPEKGSYPLPLAILSKGLLQELDVLAHDGTNLSVVTSGRDSFAAQAAMLACLAVFAPGETPSLAAEQKLFDVARKHPSPADAARILGVAGQQRGIEAWSMEEGLQVSADDVLQWKRFFEFPDFVALLTQFTTNFMLVAQPPITDGNYIVKLRYVESTTHPVSSWQLGLWRFSPIFFEYDVSSVGRAQREHLRLVAPEGMQVQSSLLFIDDPNESSSAPVEPEDAGESYLHRETLERALFYTNTGSRDAHKLLVWLRPSIEGFMRPAVFSAAVSFVVVFLGFLAELFGGTGMSLHAIAKGSSDAAVALLLVVPTLFSTYVTRSDEHALRGYLLRPSRGRVLAAGTVSAICAITIVAGASHEWLLGIWGAGSLLCAYVLAYVIDMARAAQQAERQISQNQAQTFRRSILRF